MKTSKKNSKIVVYFFSHNLTTKLTLPKETIDYVVHMAGIASPTHYKKKPLETIDVALEGVRSTLEISKTNNAKFLFTSSSEVYQTATVIPTPESYIGAIASNNERSCYDVSKLMAENYVYVYSKIMASMHVMLGYSIVLDQEYQKMTLEFFQELLAQQSRESLKYI